MQCFYFLDCVDLNDNTSDRQNQHNRKTEEKTAKTNEQE